MTQRLDKVKTNKVPGPNSQMGSRPKIKINTVARTKFGVYSYPSLRIAENQELGKEKDAYFVHNY